VYGAAQCLSMLFVNVRRRCSPRQLTSAPVQSTRSFPRACVVGAHECGFVPSMLASAHATRESHACPTCRKAAAAISKPVQLRDAVPEVYFLNSHDGTSAYQLRMGIFRVVCTNGLIVSRGAFRRTAHPPSGDRLSMSCHGRTGNFREVRKPRARWRHGAAADVQR